jgi:Xaa-Pro aminopeptidase
LRGGAPRGWLGDVPDIHAARRERLSALLAGRDLSAALVGRLVNVRYLTGFTGSNAAVLVTVDGPAVLATDGRYGDQAAEECPDIEVVVDRRLLPVLAQRAADLSARKLGVETHALTVDGLDAVRAVGDLETSSLARAVEGLRVDKDDTELALIREACAMSCRALEALLSSPLRGRSERDIAQDLANLIHAEGAEGLAFPTIVAAGPHGGIPHHQPTDRPVDTGDLLTIDFGARNEGYHADCTRTMAVGTPPASWQQEIYTVVWEAQRAGRHALVPGTDLKAVDAAARDVVAAAGYGERFTHGLGHGVGLEIHEDPFFAKSSEGKLGDRAPVTVEPGIYLAGQGGVRIEDTLIVRDGEVELLTPASKDLLVVD